MIVLKKEIKKHMLKVILGILVIGLLLISLEQFNSWFFQFGPNELIAFFNSFGILSYPLFVSMYALGNVMLIPSVPFVFTSGIVFGLLGGIILALIAEVVSGTINFYIGRKMGSNFFAIRSKSKKLEFAKKYINGHGFKVVFFLRYLGFYFDIVSYAAGMTKIKYRDYIVATFLGFIPYIIIYVYAGRQLLDIKSSAFIYTILIFKVVLFSTFLIGYFVYMKLIRPKLVKNETNSK
ncbi:TVP38/TMEM64 family protein [Patescibacteria group bacterium]